MTDQHRVVSTTGGPLITRWRCTRFYSWTIRHVIGLGLASGGMYSPPGQPDRIFWRGKRCEFFYRLRKHLR